MEPYRSFLNPRFYDEGAVLEAISDFSEAGNISFDCGKVNVVSHEPTLSSKDLFYEFSNYVLGLMKNKAVV
jgi:hypothetical protein